jgi:hypothetical protein
MKILVADDEPLEVTLDLIKGKIHHRDSVAADRIHL